jgi:AraC-like DNA-binding protein
MSVFIARRARTGALTPFVASLHLAGGEMSPGLERVLPNGLVHVMVNLDADEFRTYRGTGAASARRAPGAALVGPHAQASVIDTAEQRAVIAVGFRTGGAAPVPLAEARDGLIDLSLLWGDEGAVLRERLLLAPTADARFDLLEAVLLRRLAHAEAPDPLVPLAAAALARGLPVAQVAESAGLLPRTLTRRFERATGLTPKRYARIRRLQRLVTAAARATHPDWAELAAHYGYADQAHLVHDFRDLTGITPTQYRPRSGAERNHVPVGGG